MIKAILAATKDGGIGNNGTLPWPKNSEDLKWFKKHTMGQVVVMGRKTWDDPFMPKPLPNRTSVVVTNRPMPTHCPVTLTIDGNIPARVQTIQRIFELSDIFIIGGVSIYEACAPIINEVYLTTVNGEYETDTKLDLTKFLDGFTLIYKELTRTNTYEIWRRNFGESPQDTVTL